MIVTGVRQVAGPEQTLVFTPPNPNGSLQMSAMAVANDGGYWALPVYTNYGQASTAVSFPLSHVSQGGTQATTTNFTLPPITELYAVDLAVLNNGKPVVTWQSYTSGGGIQIYFSLFSTTGVQGGTVVVSSAPNTGSPQVVTRPLSDGGFVIAYNEGSGKQALSFYNDDGSSRGFQEASSFSPPLTVFSLAPLKGGGVVEVFADNYQGVGSQIEALEYRIFSNAGALVKSGQLMSRAGTIDYYPKVIGLDDGGFAVAFDTLDSSSKQRPSVQIFDVNASHGLRPSSSAPLPRPVPARPHRIRACSSRPTATSLTCFTTARENTAGLW